MGKLRFDIIYIDSQHSVLVSEKFEKKIREEINKLFTKKKRDQIKREKTTEIMINVQLKIPK